MFVRDLDSYCRDVGGGMTRIDEVNDATIESINGKVKWLVTSLLQQLQQGVCEQRRKFHHFLQQQKQQQTQRASFFFVSACFSFVCAKTTSSKHDSTKPTGIPRRNCYCSPAVW
jgi:hypothetical protein